MASATTTSASTPARKRETSATPPARTRETGAALIAALFGIPAIFLFVQAMADGEVRRQEAPVRALIGDAAFEALADGEKTAMHYYGDTLLAPDFTLQDQNGNPWRLADARGKVVVMNFWTITCKPCVQEMPSLVQLAALAENNPNLEVVAVTTDKRWEEVSHLFPPDSKLRVLFDPERRIVNSAYGTRLFPETWFIDAQGVVRLRVDGPRDWAAPLALDAINSLI